MSKGNKSASLSTRLACTVAVVYVAFWLWLVIDRWTGTLGFLHGPERTEVGFWLAVLGFMACIGWLTWLWSAGHVGARVRSLWGFPLVIIVSAVAGILLPGPPFGWSRGELDRAAADIGRESTSEVRVLDFGSETTRIGSYDFVRIRDFSGEEILFEEKYPKYNWTGRGLVYTPNGEPTHVRDEYEYLELEPEGGGWYSFSGSL